MSDAYQMLAGWNPFPQFHIKEILLVIAIPIPRIAIYVLFKMLGFKLPFTACTSCLSLWWCAHARHYIICLPAFKTTTSLAVTCTINGKKENSLLVLEQIP